MYIFRAELEATYAKGLSKLSSKLTKACAKDQGGYQFYINFASISLIIIHNIINNYIIISLIISLIIIVIMIIIIQDVHVLMQDPF